MRTKRGSIIAFSVILLSILLTSGLSVVTVATLEKQSSLSTQKSVVAFQAADSGIERVLKRIYIDNSPSAVPLNGSMPDATLQQVAVGLQGVRGASCNGGTNKIVATSSNEPAYVFEVSFFDGSDVQITCSDTAWRDKAVRLKIEGFYRQTSRVIELGIKPREICGAGETVQDADGNSYDTIAIGTQCWMKQNMRVGTTLIASEESTGTTGTPQSDNGIIEKYCYNNDPDNCTDDHPNEPDGGLYTWDEAMQYSTTEGAQGICPLGWHIPTNMDAYTLENYLDPTVNNPVVGFMFNRQGNTIGLQLRPGGSSGFEMNYAGWHIDGSNSNFASREEGGENGSGGMWISEEGGISNDGRMDSIDNISVFRRLITRGYALSRFSVPVRCIKD